MKTSKTYEQLKRRIISDWLDDLHVDDERVLLRYREQIEELYDIIYNHAIWTINLK